MLEAAQLHLVRIDVELLDPQSNMPLVAMDHPELIGGYHGEFMLAQVDDPVGASGQRGGVAGQKVLAPAHADDQRAAPSGSNEHPRPAAEEYCDAERALQSAQCLRHGFCQKLEAVTGHVGVGFAPAAKAPVDQMTHQRRGSFDPSYLLCIIRAGSPGTLASNQTQFPWLWIPALDMRKP